MTAGQVIVLSILIAIVAAWGAWRLYRRVTRAGRRLNLLIEALEAGDTSLRFPATADSDVNRQLNRVAACLAEMKRAAVESDRFHRAVMDEISTGVLVYDASGRVVAHNPALLALLSRPAVVNVESLAAFNPAMPEFLLNATPGAAMQFGGIAVAVTMFSGRDESPLLIATFDDIAPQLEAKSLDEWMEMSRVLTHEIMNGIAPVLSLTETMLARRGDGDDYIAEGLRSIAESCDDLKSFVRRYNRVTRVAAPEPAEFDVVETLERCAGVAAGLEGGTRLQIRLGFPADKITAYADSGQVRQIIVNLLKNALDAGATEVFLGCRGGKAGSVEIVVENNGEPVPDSLRDRIFTPLFTTKKHGSGVGLSVSRRMASANGGSLLLAPAPGGSPLPGPTRFLLTLPAGPKILSQ